MKSNPNPLGIRASFRTDAFSVSLSDYRSGLRQSWHCHEEPILTLILAGYVREEVKCVDTVAGPLKVGVKPAGLPHTDHFWRDGLQALRLSFAPAFLVGSGGALPNLGPWGWSHGSPAIAPLLRLAHGLRHGDSAETELTDHVHEAIAALRPASPRRSAAAPTWLRRARERLDASYSDGVRLTQLAREAGVHPVYFARQFRRFFGCSVGRYIRQLQFRAAASLIARRNANLAQVACRIGFSDQAHLTRTFASEFGITPGQFRHIVS